jgi:trimeric autotransporter adhesin
MLSMRRARTRTWARRAPAVSLAGLLIAALAGGGQAAAASRPDRVGAPGARHESAAGVISTVAGGVGGPEAGTDVALAGPCGLSFGGGNLYIGDTSPHQDLDVSGAVRVMSPGSDLLTTIAGNREHEPYANGIPATQAFVNACASAVDGSGNLVLSDIRHDQIRVVAASNGTFYGIKMTAGYIYAVAGDGTRGFSGDGGPALKAELGDPQDVAVDAAGNLVLADTGNDRIRVVAEKTGTFYGIAMTAGNIYTVAGDGSGTFSGEGGPALDAGFVPNQVTLDGAGNLIISDSENDRVFVVAASTGMFYGQAMTAGDFYTVAGDGNGAYSGDGGPALDAGLTPGGVALDDAGNLVIADPANHRIRVVAEHTGTYYGQAMTAQDIYTIAGTGTSGYSGNGGPALNANLNSPYSPVFDSAGNLVFTDVGNYRVRVVAGTTGTFYGIKMTAGHVYTIAGTGNPGEFSGAGGPATSAELVNPAGPAYDAAGNLLFTDYGRIQVVAGSSATFYGQKMTAGDLYTIAGDSRGGYSGDGGPAVRAQLLPEDVTVDKAGNVVICDAGNYRIRVVAEHTGTYYGRAMTSGDIYTVAGDGSVGFSGDGGPATQAGMTCDAVAVDAAGNLVISDGGANRIRVVAESTGMFYGQAMTAGDIYTVAGDGSDVSSGDGGPALDAGLGAYSVTLDNAGNLVISDNLAVQIRVVAEHTGTYYGQAMTAGDIYAVAGDGSDVFSGDGGSALKAGLFAGPVTVDAAGNLVISDRTNNRVRVVAEQPGTFYGVSMTAGNIYTVAGNGTSGFSGDGGPAIDASLNGPNGTAVDATGNLAICDQGNSRIRTVTG